MQRVATILEARLLQEGTVSSAISQLVEQGFGIQALNMSLATVSDLCALLRVQLGKRTPCCLCGRCCNMRGLSA